MARRIGYLRAGRRGSDTRAPSVSGDLEIWSVNPDGTDCKLEMTDSLSVRSRTVLILLVPRRTFGRVGAQFRQRATRERWWCDELASGRRAATHADRKTVDAVVWASNGNSFSSSRTSRGARISGRFLREAERQSQITHGTAPVISARISADTKSSSISRTRLSRTSGFRPGRPACPTGYVRGREFPGAMLSPHGRQIAVLIGSLDVFDPERQLVVMDRQGKNRRALTSASQIADVCRWSPDGKWLAYTSRPAGDPHGFRKGLYLGCLQTPVLPVGGPGAPHFIGSIADPSRASWIGRGSLLYSLKGLSDTRSTGIRRTLFPCSGPMRFSSTTREKGEMVTGLSR